MVEVVDSTYDGGDDREEAGKFEEEWSEALFQCIWRHKWAGRRDDTGCGEVSRLVGENRELVSVLVLWRVYSHMNMGRKLADSQRRRSKVDSIG